MYIYGIYAKYVNSTPNTKNALVGQIIECIPPNVKYVERWVRGYGVNVPSIYNPTIFPSGREKGNSVDNSS